MKVQLLGISKAEGKSKSTGSPYSGYFLYYGSTSDEKVIGMKAGDTFADAMKVAPHLAKVGNDPAKLVGQKYVFDFDDRGRLQEIVPLG